MSADPAPVTVTVNPTVGTVVTVDVRYVKRVTIQAQNLDGSQTYSGFVTGKVARSMSPTLVPIIAFASIAPAGSVDADGNPTDSVSADIDCGGYSDVTLVAKASGVGGSLKYAVRQGGPK